MKKQICCIIVSLIILTGSVFAQIELNSVFDSGMVLQRNTTVNIWGKASAGAQVTITGSCMVNPVTVRAGSGGQWQAGLETKGAGGPYNLIITDRKDNSAIELTDILCGEVWLCSGQSNMAMSVGNSNDAQEEIANADYPNIRLFQIPRLSSPDKQDDVNAKWQVCSPENIPDFSAAGYYFGRKLHKELNVPIGLIHSSWGGSRIEAWIPTLGYEDLDRLSGIYEEIKAKTPGSSEYNSKLKEAMASVEKWQKEALQALKDGKAVNDLPAVSLNLQQGNHGIQGLYNAMIHPIVPYTIKGVIWYQGESNRLDGMLYYEKMKALIGGWRSVWNQGDFPFYYVHLAPYRYADDEWLPLVWEAQLHSLTIPNTGMAVTNDIGNYQDIHPKNKQDVGKRLALWALAKDYGKTALVYSGPLFKSADFAGGKAVVKFDHSGSGLTTRDGKAPDWFEVAGDDGVFHKANAEITGKDTVTVWSEEVTSPKIVRLGWNKRATPNLMNKEGLPTPAFSSDIQTRLLPEGENFALNKPYTCTNENTHGTAWRQGLNDGSWAENSVNCFASNESDKFPKYATIDLEQIKTVSKVYIGVPAFGSTRNVEIQLSTNAKDFKTVGKYEFSLKKSEKALISFPPQQARYVRVAYLDTYKTRVNYNENFVFTTEVEVYKE
ncbi:F5/8 type C domain protein [Limihaloglobus sulfuriphilus]|uniref:F5/8 type C domain protein n=1 Tax=Limihaloglobus sulfuriphilus TaxID=1851148 RepID=A0A1Q2MC23_9BACT|nr:sialate O-acetylesterase [Limihaloglobus sulfuriphilus]AQQ69792.1 F5/8 type C domain protein [Limihaloglobus sulfuriphilus]